MKLKSALLITVLALSSGVLSIHCGESASGIAMYASAKSGLIVRSAPSTGSEKLGLIPYRGEVTVLEQGENEETIAGKTGRWALIDHNGQDGWVFGGFLTASQPEKAPAAPKVTSLEAGDIACYVELDYGDRQVSMMADFGICEQPLVGKRITFETRKESVMAASCEGDPECGDSETVELMIFAKAL
ncbi:MAG: SH3 domain-containing protein [bacterium]|nr:SH3 domain-containing protein [bacterium]